MRHWEDFPIDSVDEFGGYTITEQEIVDFGKAFDPMPYHVDPAAAADGPYDGLIAPGLLVCAAYMRMLVDHVLADAASMGSPGVDSIRWRVPVRPGDQLYVHQQVLESRVLKSRPGLGLIKTLAVIRNQQDTVVAELQSNALFARRAAEQVPAS